MAKRKLLFISSLLLTVTLFYSLQQEAQGQTIPTPTPVSQPVTDTPVPPTVQPTSTDDDDVDNPPPINTPGTGPTATPIPAVTFAPTPEGGLLPTAAPCSDSPTIQAFNTLNVRQGPGIDYTIIDTVVFLEVRPIIGRSAHDQWWLIERDNGEPGWVADATGLAQGYIGNVPVATAPAINSETPTPGPTWQPTPRPTCTVTPTATPTPTASATATPSPTALSTATPTAVVASSTPTSTPNTADEADAATRIALAALANSATSTPIPTPYPPLPTATPLEVETPISTPNFLPILGLVLVAGGIFVAIARRQFSKQ